MMVAEGIHFSDSCRIQPRNSRLLLAFYKRKKLRLGIKAIGAILETSRLIDDQKASSVRREAGVSAVNAAFLASQDLLCDVDA
jgi:hypothetical protein